MKLPTKIILIIVIILSVGVAVFMAIRTENVSFILKPSQEEILVGEKLIIPIYLSGQNSQDTLAIDIKLDFDKTKLELISATAGDFFESPLIVKWDQENAWFALSKKPDKARVQTDTDSAVLTLEFLAISKSGSSEVSIKPDSQVYISNKGGVSPDSKSISVAIK